MTKIALKILPKMIKDSSVFSLEEKEVLASIDCIPTDVEVDEIRYLPQIQELLNAFIGDENTMNTHLQLLAQDYLKSGNIQMAWKIILL